MERSSYSALNKHRVCPQAWNYAYLQDLTKDAPDDVAVPLHFGTWAHALFAAEAIDRGRRLESLKSCPETLLGFDGPYAERCVIETKEGPVVPMVLYSMRDWWDRLSEEIKVQWVDWIGCEPVSRLSAIFDGWMDLHREDLDREKPLAVEYRWKRELPADPGGGEHDTELVGYVDYIYFDERRNVLVACDRKFAKSIETSTADDMMDSQLQVYSWGASPEVRSWGYGPIRATSYDRMRSVAPKEPKLTAAGGLSKSVTDYDLRTYLAWVGEGRDWGEEGDYVKTGKNAGKPRFGTYTVDPAEVERLSSEETVRKWYVRTLTPLNANIVKAHLLSAVQTAVDIQRTKAQVERTGMAGRNLTSGCKWCDFKELCRAQMIGGPEGEYDLADLKLRKKHA